MIKNRSRSSVLFGTANHRRSPLLSRSLMVVAACTIMLESANTKSASPKDEEHHERQEIEEGRRRQEGRKTRPQEEAHRLQRREGRRRLQGCAKAKASLALSLHLLQEALPAFNPNAARAALPPPSSCGRRRLSRRRPRYSWPPPPAVPSSVPAPTALRGAGRFEQGTSWRDNNLIHISRLSFFTVRSSSLVVGQTQVALASQQVP